MFTNAANILTVPTFDAAHPSHWSLTTNIELKQEVRTIRTDADYLAYHNGDMDPTEDNAEWWANVLTPIHAAVVLTAAASPEEIERAAASLDVDHTDDPAYDLMRYQSGLDLETCAKCARDVALALISARRATTGATDD